MGGGLWWTQHARERLEQRFGLTVEEFVEQTNPETLAMCAAGAFEARVGHLNLLAVLSGDVGVNNVVTVLPIKKGPKRKRPRMNGGADAEWS